MNCLILRPEELVAPNRAVISGARYLHVKEAHDPKAGISVRAGILGGNLGTAKIETVTASEITLSLDLKEKPLERAALVWIVAVSRPQTVKKVLQLAATLGISELHFIRTSQVEKSYFQSPVLQPHNMEVEVLKGLEQAGDTIAPRVQLHRFYKPFIEDVLPSLLKDVSAEIKPICLIAHTRSDSNELLAPKNSQTCVIAVGPEPGWSEQEVEQFCARGFMQVSLGSRFLRVDTACVHLSASVEALRRRRQN